MTKLEVEVSFDELFDLNENELNLLGFKHEVRKIGQMTEDLYKTGDDCYYRIRSSKTGVDHRGYAMLKQEFFFNGIRTKGSILVGRI